MVVAEKNSVGKIFLHGVITSGFTLTERWEVGNYHIIFWSMTSKAEFSSESLVLFLYIFSIYVAATHLATTFYKNMEHKNRNRLSLLSSAFDVTHQKNNMVVTSLPSLGQGEKIELVFFAIIIRRIRSFYTYKNLQLIYTL